MVSGVRAEIHKKDLSLSQDIVKLGSQIVKNKEQRVESRNCQVKEK